MSQLIGCRDVPKDKFYEIKQELMQAGELRELKTKNEKIHVLIALLPIPYTIVYYEDLETVCVSLGYPKAILKELIQGW